MKNYDKLFVNTKNTISIRIELATLIGANEAIALARLDFHLNGFRLYANVTDDSHYVFDKWWWYSTFEDWQKNDFPFWGLSTVKRTFKSLIDSGIVIQRKDLNKNVMIHKSWFSINYELLDEMYEKGITLNQRLSEFLTRQAERENRKNRQKCTEFPIGSKWTNRMVQDEPISKYNNIYNSIPNNNNTDNNNKDIKTKGSFSDKEEDFGRTVERSETECEAERSPLSVSETEGAKATIPVKGEDRKSRGCSVKNVSTKDLFMPEVLRRCLTTSADYTEHVVKRIIEISELYNSYYNGLTGKYLICVPQKVEDVAQKMTTPVSESSGVSLVDLDLETVDLMIQKHIGTNYAWGNDYNIFLFLEPENLKNRYYEVTT